MSDIRTVIADAIGEHWSTYGSDCCCGWSTEPTMSHSKQWELHLTDVVQTVLERWMPPLFASAIHGYADAELTSLSYHGDGSAEEALNALNHNAAGIASYAFASTKWRPAHAR